MDYAKHSVGNPALLLLFFVGVFYLFLWSSSVTNDSSNTTTHIHAPHDQDDLEEALSKASMANKTEIITIVNKAYAEQDVGADTTMLDLFLESFWFGEDTRSLLDHLLLVDVDQRAYDRCVFRVIE